MNVKLQIGLDFPAGIYYRDQLNLNRYLASVQFCTATTDHDQINIAMDRVKMFVYSELNSTVFICDRDPERIEVLDILGVNVTTLPEEPIDQIIGIMLYCKLSAITEGRLIVESVDISSSLGDDVRYLHEFGDPIGPFQQDGWWNTADTSHNNIVNQETDKTVLKVPNTNWTKYNLGWSDSDRAATGKTVSFNKTINNANQ